MNTQTGFQAGFLEPNGYNICMWTSGAHSERPGMLIFRIRALYKPVYKPIYGGLNIQEHSTNRTELCTRATGLWAR